MDCSVGQLSVIRVKGDNYMYTKFPEISKSCSDDSCCDIITTPSNSICLEDIRVLFCWNNLSPTMITLGNNTFRDHFVGVDLIKDGSHLCLKVRDDTAENLTQMVKLDSAETDIFALAFKSHDGKLYYVNSPGTGQPLVIDSRIEPQYIFLRLIPTEKAQGSVNSST